jgi:AP-4 complex subunit beta-1
MVIANSIIALDEILAEEGGMRLNKAIAEYLIRRLKDFNEWGQCAVLDLLTRYQPEYEDECYEFMVHYEFLKRLIWALC